MFNVLAHLFVPRRSNNHKAKILHSSSLLALALFIVFFQLGLGFLQAHGGSVLGYAANISPSEVERLINVQRQNSGLAALSDNPVLDGAAQAKGNDMIAKGYWAHVAPDGTQPWAFFVAAGYSYKYAGENLARDFADAQSAVNAWMASPTHKENILASNYQETGVGVVEGQMNGADTTIIVQFFGTRLSGASAPSKPLANAQTAVPTKTPAIVATPNPTATPVPVVAAVVPSPTPQAKSYVAANVVNTFDVSRYLSLILVGALIGIVAIDGFIINRRKIFRIAGHFPAHIAFLGMILVILLIAKAGRII